MSGTLTGGNAMPGAGTIRETVEREILWGGDRGNIEVLMAERPILGSTRDLGSTPTTDLRAGLLLGKESATNHLSEWDADASDGSEELWGVLGQSIRAIDFDGTDKDSFGCNVIVKAPLKTNQLLIQGTVLTSHADEFLARAILHGMGCTLDDDPQGYLSGAVRREVLTGADVTLTTADQGKVYICHTADVEFTLPAIHAGWKVRAVMGANQELKFTSAETGNMVLGHDLVADAIAWTTANEQIGANVEIEGVNLNGTLKWLVHILKTPFDTDDFLTFTATT